MMGMAICHTCDGPIHDGHCPDFRLREKFDSLRAALQKAEAERDEAWRWLESLTPGGSEFHRNPIRCVEFVRERREEAHRIALDLRFQLEQTRAEIEQLRGERNQLYRRLNPSAEYCEGIVVGRGEDEIDRLTAENAALREHRIDLSLRARLDSERARADRLEAKLSELTDGGEK